MNFLNNGSGSSVKPVVISVGAGFQRDLVPFASTSTVQYNSKVETKAVFANVRYVIYNGFFMQPEVAWFDHGRDAQTRLGTGYAPGASDLGSDLYAAVHFQYDF